jgi:hypothetical protein
MSKEQINEQWDCYRADCIPNDRCVRCLVNLDLIDQYAYEYAERVIGEDESSDGQFTVSGGGVSNMGQKYVRNRLRDELRKRNQQLSPHRATKDGEAK